MTEDNETPPMSAAEKRRLIFRLVAPHVVIVAVAMAAALYVVLYVIKGGRGKEVNDANQCLISQMATKRVAPFAKGQVAALNVQKNPRPMDELTFKAPNDTQTHLSLFKGKTVLLNLWATWCVPCRQEMPALDRLQQTLGSSDFEVVAINIDTARLERPKAFLNEINVKDLQYYADPSADVFQVLKRAGKVIGLPTTILIGPDGCEIGTMAGPAEWDSEDAKALINAAANK